MALNLQEQKVFQVHGRLVPELPTDNGITLRKAVLAEECIKDLVRPLRDAGWDVTVSEPDAEALYVIVTARTDKRQLSVGLLYSCATANTFYRELEKTCQIILYRGAPYHQDHVARRATVTGTRAALTAGRSAAIAPMASAQPRPNNAKEDVTAM